MKRLALALCLLAAPLQAQTDETTALAEEYVAMPEIQRMIDDMFSPESMAGQFKNGLPPNVQLSPEQETEIGEILSGVMVGLRPKVEDQMVVSSAKIFTAEELTALMEFYKSEHGASVMAKMQPYMQDTMSVMMPQINGAIQGVMPQIMEIMQAN